MDSLRGLGSYVAPVREMLARIRQERWVERLWAKDPTLWKREPEHQRLITGMLGWLDVVERMQQRLPELAAVADAVRADGIRDIVLLGMGGSSLCPEVQRATFGSTRGYPALTVLDSTDPETIRSVERAIDLRHALFIVASKSGTTIEPDSLMRYFFECVRSAQQANPGKQFLAITDPGTALERWATEQRFRWTFLNPADIGGRYSALSCFGLVPAALIGMDLRRWLAAAADMTRACGPGADVEENPGVLLGAVLGVLAKAGRDKMTLCVPPELASFGLWVEQLVAESVGKEGCGIVPISGESLGLPGAYGADRFFLEMTAGEASGAAGERLAALEMSGHPVFRVSLNDRYALAGEFFRWEVATAIAGACLGVNPFDQPNVQEAKDRTGQLLQSVAGGAVASGASQVTTDQYDVTVAEAVWKEMGDGQDLWARWWGAVRPGMYVSLLAYLPYHQRVADRLDRLRHQLRDRLGVAVTWAYGPRYLHSTGQLHKGGLNTGLFLLLVGEDSELLAIPDRPFTFSRLKTAQAMGDFASLADKGRRVALVRLRQPLDASLNNISQELVAPLAKARVV